MTQLAARRLRRLVLVVAVVLFAGGCTAGAIAWNPAIRPIAPPAPASFPAATVAQGATLAAIGDCAVCHTAAHGAPFAGGRPIPTPFGTIYATNITPDPTTGIGHWSLAAFRRALRHGIGRSGEHLYPALPYTHFTHATDADIAALYAFLMTRRPVHAVAPANLLPFPLDWRPLLAGWNLLYLHPGVWHPDPAQSAEWNRGAYLVQALGHCGACHTPRNGLGAEETGQALAGGEAEGWYAPPLQAGSPAPHKWTVAELTTYLRTGVDRAHGAAAGPMRQVTEQLATVPAADLHAIAVYIAALMPPARPTVPPRPAPVADSTATAIFTGACAACHAADAPMTRDGAPSLARSTAVNATTPRNVIAIILHGLPWRDGHAGPYMPGFADALTNAQVAAIAAYVRAHYTDRPPWPHLPAAVRAARHDQALHAASRDRTERAASRDGDGT